MKQLSVIGLSNAGKTCYLYAMAKTLLNGCGGITVIANERDDMDRLIEGWRRIREERLWPEGTDLSSTYEFNCSLNLETIMNFRWNDFQGGKLSSMSEIDRQFHAEFDEYLLKSDGLIIFLPADVLQIILHGEENSNRFIDDFRILMTFFHLNKATLAKIPITLVITKKDLLKNDEEEYIYSIVKEIFSPLFEKGNNIKVMIVSVSIGTELQRTTSGEIRGVIYENPKDGNIHIPIIFNLYQFLMESIAKEKENLLKIDDTQRQLNEQIYIVSNHSQITRWINRESLTSLRTRVSDIENQHKQTSNKILQLEKYLNKVKGLFTSDCMYYIDGDKVEI